MARQLPLRPARPYAMLLPLLLPLLSANAPTKKPHIFTILADDFGWHNIGFRNPEIRSPNLDKAFATGITLNRHYVFKYCSPTRSSLLTGRLPLHVNQNNEANLIVSKSGIDIRMSLLPKRLKAAGYATAMTGKGHLGARSHANLPVNRGFDRHFGFLKGGEDHQTQCLGDTDFHGPDLWRDHGPAHGENGTFSTLLYGHEAVRIVKEHKLPGPLYVYLPYQVTHSPYQIPPGPYENPSDPVQRRTFNAMVNIMDEAFGNLTQVLTTRSMIDDTLIMFSADNGGVYHNGQLGNNWPLRGQKTSDWEGGVRATAFLWGGANVLPSALRGTESNAFIHVCDWYATLLTLVGIDPADGGGSGTGFPAIDSMDQWSVLLKPNATVADSLRTELPLSFCPNTDPELGNRGADNCCPTAEGGGWEANGTAIPPSGWRNGALIQKAVSDDGKTHSFFKLVWGTQFGFGVHTSPNSPNASGQSHNSSDPGCPIGCVFDILADPNEINDISLANPNLFASMLKRQSAIGLTVHQTNYSDVPDSSCA